MPLTFQPYYRKHGDPGWTPYGAPTPNMSVTISGLSSSQPYDFQVTAINAFGTTPSSPVYATTLSAQTINSLSLAPQTFTAGSQIGTVVGTISVVMSSGSFTGAYSVTGTDAASFQIGGGSGNQLQLKVSNTTPKTYSINIVATMTGVPTFTQNFPNIVGNPAIVESSEGFVVQGTDYSTIMYASQTLRNGQSSGPYLQFSMISTNGNSVNLLAPGQSLITTASGSVSKIVYGDHTCFQTNTSGGWWYWDTTKPFAANNWNPFGINTLSGPSTYPTGATNNTVIGPITVTMLTSTDTLATFNGTLTVSDSTNSFKIVSGQLVATKTLSGSYTPTITAIPYTTTDPSAQVLGSTLVITPTLVVAGGLMAPAIASAAGFNTLVWSDDFTTTTSIASSYGQGYSGTPGNNAANRHWWPGGNYNTLDGWTVQPTWTAASIPLGQGAGGNASTAGGILILNGQHTSGGNSFLTTIPEDITSVPAGGNPVGTFNQFYVECYMAHDPATLNNVFGTGSHNFLTYWFPAFWGWTVETYHTAANSFGGPNSALPGLNATPTTEIDFFEDTGLIDFGGGNGPLGESGHQGYIPGGAAGNSVTIASGSYSTENTQWHTIGFLWDKNNGISFYKDGVQSGTTFPASQIIAQNPSWASQHLFLILGTGYQYPMYIDWVRVWAAP